MSFYDEKTEKEGRHRLKDPARFKSFFRRRSKSAPGVVYLMGIPKTGDGAEVQALRFQLSKWPEKKAAAWYAKNQEHVEAQEQHKGTTHHEGQQKSEGGGGAWIVIVIVTVIVIGIGGAFAWRRYRSEG